MESPYMKAIGQTPIDMNPINTSLKGVIEAWLGDSLQICALRFGSPAANALD
jgi:hypothetical protein